MITELPVSHAVAVDGGVVFKGCKISVVMAIHGDEYMFRGHAADTRAQYRRVALQPI